MINKDKHPIKSRLKLWMPSTSSSLVFVRTFWDEGSH